VSSALAQAPPVDATRRLYEQHSSRIFGFCLSRLGSREEAEDAVQTTFMNAQRGLGRGVVPQYELAWLFKIAQNVCHNRHQSARRRGRLEAVQDLDALQDVIASPERSPSVSLGELTSALGAIPKRQRQALVLREFQGLTYEEIADELGVSVAAVETLLFRARRSVALELERNGATTSSRGAIASIFELFRWLFSGGAAPLKIAAVTAAVATTATVATVPLVRDQAPAPAAPSVSTPHLVVPAVQHGVQKPTPPPVAHAAKTVASKPATASSTVHVSAATHVASTSSSPAQTPPSQAAPAAPSTQTLPVQQVTTPTLPAATVPDLPIPDLPLPNVTVPSVQLPVPLPEVKLPQLP
jgi:RNA polymerase sigma-70 factor, ECF subfamily